MKEKREMRGTGIAAYWLSCPCFAIALAHREWLLAVAFILIAWAVPTYRKDSPEL